jgi:hypothetical protein
MLRAPAMTRSAVTRSCAPHFGQLWDVQRDFDSTDDSVPDRGIYRSLEGVKDEYNVPPVRLRPKVAVLLG